MYGHFQFFANIGLSSDGYCRKQLANGGDFNAHQMGIDLALIDVGLRFKALLFVLT